MPFTVKETDKSRYPDPVHWNEVYEGLIVPAVQEVGLQCERDDKDIGSRFIGENILRKIEDADLILCDLSSHNPNVFLELGWAIRADSPFVLIKDDLTTYTFDLNQQYTFDYSHALQPTRLRQEVNSLADVLRRTLNDSERRYSVIRRMSISLSAMKAIKGGDLQTEILLDVQRKLTSMQVMSMVEEGVHLKPKEYPWPKLLRQSMAILFEVMEAANKFDTASSGDEIISVLDDVSTKFGAKNSKDVQISLVDEKRKLLYHDWGELVGSVARFLGADEYDIYDEIYLYPHGAVAWVDRTSNTRERPMIRMNIALFSTIDHLNWKAVIESHHEVY